MSYDNSSTGLLDRSAGPCPMISMGWWRQFNYGGTGHTLLSHGSSNGNDSSFGTDGTVGTTLVGGSQGGGTTSFTMATDSDTSWVFICQVLVQGSGVQFYWRHEGETTLQSGFLPDAGINDVSDDMIMLNGNSGGGGVPHCRLTAYKEWQLDTALTSTQIFAESTQNAPIVVTGLTNYLQCDAGHSVGVDQSGLGNDWTVVGTFTTNADEPNMLVSSNAVIIPLQQFHSMNMGFNF